jgi:hypothetical protein
MAYFKNIPNILYLQYKKNPFDGHYIEIKNIFSRIKIVDSVLPSATVFEDYYVKESERPDSIAFDRYGDPGLDWTILMINKISNFYEDWPKDRNSLDDYINLKYTDPSKPQSYRTIAQTYKGQKVLDAGLEVGESFQFVKPNGDVVPKLESRAPFSFYEYESKLNDSKREILILNPEYIDQFVEIVIEEMKYTPSTEYVNEKLKYSKN